MIVRRGEIRDVAALIDLNAHVHQPHVDEHPDLFRPTTERSGIEEYFTSILTDLAHYVLVAEMESRPVGYLAAQVQRRGANAFSKRHDRLYVHQVSVDPQFRRRGVGRALFAEIERTARSESLTEVALDTWAFNQGAQRFFEALGFSVFNVRMWKRGVSSQAEYPKSPIELSD